MNPETCLRKASDRVSFPYLWRSNTTMFLVILIQFRFLLCECICTYLMEKDCVKCLRSTNSLPGYWIPSRSAWPSYCTQDAESRVPGGERGSHSSILVWESHGQRSPVGSSPRGHRRAGRDLATEQQCARFLTICTEDGKIFPCWKCAKPKFPWSYLKW